MNRKIISLITVLAVIIICFSSCAFGKTGKMPTVIYDSALDYDNGEGGLKIFIPATEGYINYNFVRTVNDKKNADIWRMSVVNTSDDDLNILQQITKSGAEWEMAVRLSGRPDFIGGCAHGDEKFTEFKVTIDGKETDYKSLTENTKFKEMLITVVSDGFDPSEPTVKVMEHTKNFTINKDGIKVDQKIKWLGDYELDQKFKSFMAMMPPLKHELDNKENLITDHYYSDFDMESKEIKSLPKVLGYVTEFYLTGDNSGLTFSMKVDEYDPLYSNAYLASLSDNGGENNYNKMYFAFAGGNKDQEPETVTNGMEWTSSTTYSIDRVQPAEN